jgi:hypothetical protein
MAGGAAVSDDTVIAATMEGILYALASEEWTHYSAVDESIATQGGDVNRKRDALKRLRDIGFTIVVDKHAHHTMWKANPTDDEVARFDRGAQKDTYSRFVSKHRSYVGQFERRQSTELATLIQASEIATVFLGRSLGMPLLDIARDLTPVVP